MNPHDAPVAAPVTPVDARREMQPVHIVVSRRPDPDHRVVDLDKSSGGRNCDNGTSVWIHGAKSPHRGDRKVGLAKCFGNLLIRTKHPHQEVEQQL